MRPCALEYTPLATGCKGCRPASWARDLVAARGITINGLPVIDARYRNLHLFFLDHVIGGPGAFAIPAHGFKDFAAAVLSKLIREIAGTTPSSNVAMEGGRKASAAGQPGRSACVPGCRLSRHEFGGRWEGTEIPPKMPF